MGNEKRKMKSNSTATAVIVLVLGLGLGVGLAYFFGAFDLLRGGPKESERQTNANAGPPGRDAADGPAGQLAADGRKLDEKVKLLDEAVRALPDERDKALAAGSKSPATEDFLKHLKEDVPNLSQEVKQDYEKLYAGLAALKDSGGREEVARTLKPEQQDLVNAVSRENRNRALPVLVLLSLLLLATVAQFFLLRRQQNRMVVDKDELLVNMKAFVIEIKGSIDEDLKGTRQSLGELSSGQQTLAANVTQTLSGVGDMQQAFDRLAYSVGKGGAGGGVEEAPDAFFEQQNKSARAGGNFVYENEETAEQSEPHRFPASVGEYMRLVERSAHPVRADYINDVLVEDQSSNGALVLVKNPPAVSDGTSYVVPSIDYFLSEQDYVKNYSNYFDCSEQQAGYVWIDKPAVVTKVADGWRLVDRGVLEVKQ
jgi:hypothetical protein